MGKDERFTEFNVDLEKLADHVEKYGKEKGFEVGVNKDTTAPPSWFQIQMHKKGLFRTVTGTRRSLDCVIRGHPEDFEVAVGTGEWGKNIAAAGLIGVLTVGGAILTMGVGTVTYKRTESQLWGGIRAKIESLRNSHKPEAKPGLRSIQVASAKDVRFCTKCGEELPATAKFCDVCGIKLR
ncbi:MAG: zinc ribbon domain-containing protein [Thaumarchaeota archaeon]|nr:zinc ribbon domain-containing protein [Nitrososphaerota archaeon]